MRKSFPTNPWFYPLPVLIIGTYGEDGTLIGQIAGIRADEKVLGADNKPDPKKLRAIAFDPIQNGYLVLGERVCSAFSDGAKLK